MIRFEEALDIVLKHAGMQESEAVRLGNSVGRYLAENIYADLPMPPFNKSAMDGFACRKEDLKMELEVMETIAAGSSV
jgi:molybdopterin molybdotransferase